MFHQRQEIGNLINLKHGDLGIFLCQIIPWYLNVFNHPSISYSNISYLINSKKRGFWPIPGEVQSPISLDSTSSSHVFQNPVEKQWIFYIIFWLYIYIYLILYIFMIYLFMKIYWMLKHVYIYTINMWIYVLHISVYFYWVSMILIIITFFFLWVLVRNKL